MKYTVMLCMLKMKFTKCF